jgi:mono/diheme cytochrome c family protein
VSRPRSFVALLGIAALALAGSLALAGLAVAAPTAPPTPTPVPAAGIGKQLFVAKGCITCHRHDAVAVQRTFTFDDMPNLTAYRNDPAYLRTWLQDPAAVKPATEMPDLGLSAAEIEALIAFINDPMSP